MHLNGGGGTFKMSFKVKFLQEMGSRTNINDSEKMDPRSSYAPTPGQYTCIFPKYSNNFSSETTWPIKAKF